MDFLAQFPRLTKVNMRDYSQFSSIQQCLQLLENSPLIEELNCSLNPEYKLQIQPSSKLLNTLSNMKDFQVYMDGNMGSVTLNNFIKQYLSGLNYLSIEGWLDSDFRDHEKPLMVDLMDIACTVKEFAVDIKYLKYNVVRQYLTSVMQKVYYEIPETRTEKIHRMLAVGTSSEDEERQPPFSVIASCSEQEPGELTRSVEIEYVLKSNNRDDLEEVLSPCSDMTDLDIFHFSINDDGLPSRAFTIFRDLLENFDCVKKVVLEVPEEVFGKRYMIKYESVTDLKILSSRMWEEYKKMKLINVVEMFPGLKKMNLSGYCGIKVDSNQYHVVLDKLDLDSLEIDVQFWANGWLQKKHNDILVSVDIIKKNIKRFYKVFYNGLQVNEIQEHEYRQSNDTKVYIKMKNLNELTLYRRRVFSIEDIKTTLSFTIK